MDINFFLLFNQTSAILISIFSIFLAFWVLLANKRSRIHRSFFCFAIFIFAWIIFCYFGNTASDITFAHFLGKLAYGVVALFFIPFYYFSILFLKEEKKYPILNIFTIISCLFLFLFSLFTDLMVVSMEFTKFGAIPVLGQGKIIYFAIISFLILFIISRFLKNYLKFSEKEKLKIQYFLIGFFIWIFTNFIFNIILPILQKTPQFWALGNYSAIFLLGFTAYAIVKRELFDIKVILTSTLVALITILLLLDIFLLTTEPLYQLFKGLIVFIFIYFGFMLIKSVKEEVKRREEAETLSRAKSEFISMASHQLRTPLTVIKGYVAMILDGSYGKIDVKTKRVLGNVSISTERLVKIIEDLLNISRIELGKMDLEKKPTDIKEMIDNICKEIKIKAKEKNLKLIWEKPKAQLPKLNVDELKIRQVIYNIVDNAIKYTNTGKVEIKLSRENSNLIIDISDTGRGFTKEDNARLFELFSRGEAGTDTFVEGTGMGLYVAKKFVNLHKGRIWAESKGKNKGSVFHIELPIK